MVINKMAKVRVYSTPECPWCKKSKAFSKENKIEIENIDVSADDQAREERVEKSGKMGCPVIDSDGTTSVGLEVEKIKTA